MTDDSKAHLESEIEELYGTWKGWVKKHVGGRYKGLLTVSWHGEYGSVGFFIYDPKEEVVVGYSHWPLSGIDDEEPVEELRDSNEVTDVKEAGRIEREHYISELGALHNELFAGWSRFGKGEDDDFGAYGQEGDVMGEVVQAAKAAHGHGEFPRHDRLDSDPLEPGGLDGLETDGFRELYKYQQGPYY